MNRAFWTKKKLTVTITLIAILAATAITAQQMTRITEAAIIDPHPGLVGWWRFDDGTGTIASDSSGDGKNGIISGATWGSGKYGQALTFDGTSSNYVSLPNLGLSGGAFSISAWVKPENNGNYRTILGYNTNRRVLIGSDGRLLTQFEGNFFSLGTVANNMWNLVVYVFDGSKEYWYMNGQYDSQHATTLPSWNAAFYVGQYDRANYPFKGTIDEVQIYNRALSPSEIQENYGKGPDISSNILAKVPKGTTQIIATISWQGIGSINATLTSPSLQEYTEEMISVYQKTSYSTSGGEPNMLNIKRLSLSVSALPSDENWHIKLDFENVDSYSISVEVQK